MFVGGGANVGHRVFLDQPLSEGQAKKPFRSFDIATDRRGSVILDALEPSTPLVAIPRRDVLKQAGFPEVLHELPNGAPVILERVRSQVGAIGVEFFEKRFEGNRCRFFEQPQLRQLGREGDPSPLEPIPTYADREGAQRREKQ